ncbi:MAG: zinc ribbon domain-containing protein [Actinobacteria bacterium]|nr:MAG: zinc ribbon domain-containing protein [Actinomycetota bacterium]
MANPLKRILRGGQAPAAPAAAPEPAPAEGSTPGEDGATGDAAARGGEPATTATEPAPAEAEPASGEAGQADENGATGDAAATRGGEPATTAMVPAPAQEPVPAERGAAGDAAAATPAPAWRLRGRARRRLRHLRAARELALRDLGGLVFDLHRFGRERPDLVAAKLDALADLDRERRALQEALDDPAGFDVLRRPGLASCARCGTLVASEARFCSSCGVSLATAHAATAGAAPETEPEHVPGAAAATSDLPGT